MTATVAPPTVVPTTDPTGVRIGDVHENVSVQLGTPEPVSPRAVSTDGFYFPVTTAVSLDTSVLRIPHLVNVLVRDERGSVVAEAVNRATATVPDGRYVLEISSLGVVCYLSVEGAVTVEPDGGERVIRTSADALRLGLRSRHVYPKATVTTTDDPRDVMRAVSCFGSALKTTSCERSWPSLRGCPPLVERGDRFDAPASLADSRSDVRIEVPPDLRYVYPVASLAYYTDATVGPGDEPRLIADGFVHPLDGSDGFEAAVRRTLEHVFLLDCVVRTEGYYPVDLAERRAVESCTDLDVSALYDAPLATQLEQYLSIPFDALSGARPTWKLTADVAPAPEHVAYLPFAALDLAHVRCRASEPAPPSELSGVVADFYRESSDASPSRRSVPGDSLERVFEPPPADSIEQAWIGDGYPVGASKPTAETCRRQLGGATDSPVRVVVVANDPEMVEERSVTDLYGLREHIAMDVVVHERTTVDELRELLARDEEFLHYVGHVDERGMQCLDGHLDARALDSVGVRAFILNACRSYEQGTALVDAGATGGVVTLEPVANRAATVVGRQTARLLNAGFSLAAALDVIADETLSGRQYMIVGDGNATVTKTKGGAPVRLDVERIGDDRFSVTFFGYPTRECPLGALYTPHIGENRTRYINGGPLVRTEVSGEELSDALELERVPVCIDGRLEWSDAITLDRSA
ncbi:CHAT domain-containing protein [Halomarina pelagica]|uniref:CHAT domain-containing protein n=1 Tax=Halomarina pelagica TaxID=2961599 RepID=UPI0020C1EC2B|nr:CHAT domain-containing protein [Halomarina sp. BND7]